MRGIDSLRYSTALRQPAAYGGIMGRDGRRRYGLGSSFKKAFKSITKPIASVVDKIIPNEIKPALPYIAAVAPFMVGPIGGLSLGASRALTAGLGSFVTQAADKGEVDNPFEIAAKSGLAYLTAPGASETLRGAQTAATMGDVGTEAVSRTAFQKAADLGLETAAKAADFIEIPQLTGVLEGDLPLLSKAGLKATAVPLGIAATEQAADAAQKALDEYNAKIAADTAIDNSERIRLITKYMTNAGFGEDQISSALSRYGYLASGGRVGYEDGDRVYMTDDESGVIYKDPSGKSITKEEWLEQTDKEEFGVPSIRMKKKSKTLEDLLENPEAVKEMLKQNKKDGGLMNLGGREMDLRGGGFVPIGAKERADDVPARLSKNEFVFTADAVRAAGGGSVDKGAQRMYNTMKMLEGKLA